MQRRRRSPAFTWMPMLCCPGRRRAGCWSGFGTARSLPGRRSDTTAGPRRPRCAATTVPGRGFRPSWPRSGAPASTVSQRQAAGGSALSRILSRTISGLTVTSTPLRWRSSIARRSWLWRRSAVAISSGSFVGSISARARRRPRPIRTAERLRLSHRPCATSAGSSQQVRPLRSTQRPTPPLPPAGGSRFRLAPFPAMGGGGTDSSRTG